MVLLFEYVHIAVKYLIAFNINIYKPKGYDTRIDFNNIDVNIKYGAYGPESNITLTKIFVWY